MKKIFIMLALVSVFTLSAFAETHEKHEEYWTDLSYVNVPVLKIMESSDAYLVLYQKHGIGTGRTVIPKSWIKGNTETPRKLKFRSVKSEDDAYMSIIEEGGEFKRVILNVPVSKLNPIWGVISSGVPLEGSDKETLEDLDF